MSLPKLSPSCRPKVRSDLQSCSSEALENRGVETKTRKNKQYPGCYENQGKPKVLQKPRGERQNFKV